MGDKLIIAVSNILENSCRKEDIITSWGGDEFIIFLPKTKEKETRWRTLDNIPKLV